MKKRVTILPIMICLFLPDCLPQAPDSIKNKKQKYCLVELTRMNGIIENFILGGFSDDSMIGYAFFKDGDKVMIQQNHRIATRSGDIRRVSIKIGKHILVAAYPGVNDTASIKNQDQKLAKDIATAAVTTYAVSTVTERVWTATNATPGLDMGFLALNLFFIPRQTWYAINGLERRYKRMVKDLTAKKQN